MDMCDFTLRTDFVACDSTPINENSNKLLTVLENAFLFLQLLFLGGLVPLLRDLLLPVLVLLDLVDPVFDNGEDLPNFKIVHVLIVVQLVRKFEQIVNFSLLLVLLLLFSCGPGGLRLLRGPNRSLF
jgi:hypothetical protein